jgi:ABC-2 type transport system ATP-binding protein
MIQIKNITKTFGKIVALNNVSFDIKDNQILALLGPNGAGKSTLMRIITGYLLQDNGTVIIDDEPVSPEKIRTKEIIGYLPENNPLYEDMTVYEYLSFISEIRNVPTQSIKDVVELCRLKDVISRNISELSKGYRQRVGFAAAILHNPKILILDEPTAGLDPNQAAEVRELIKEYKKDKTIILSTHILSEVEEVADYVVIIHKGTIVAQGNIEDLYKLVFKHNVIHFSGKFDRDLTKYLPMVIQGIYNVKVVSEENEITEYEIETEGDIDIRKDLFKLAVKENWEVVELHRVFVSLQDVFRELTSS